MACRTTRHREPVVCQVVYFFLTAVYRMYVLHLYVTGQTPRSLRAEFNLRRMCEKYLGEDYELTLIDVEARPDLAEAESVFATPLTMRVAPLPRLRVVGDLSDSASVLTALGIDPAGVTLPVKQG